MNKIEPIVKYTEDAYFEDIIDMEYENKLFTKNASKSLKIVNTTLNSCIFKKIDFSNIKFENVDIWDSIFEECDIANKEFYNNYP